MKSKNYEEFVQKFKPKKTTDDCYTPPAVYEAVKEWACRKYGIDPDTIVRPFWPGGDYENYDYPDGCTVLDNPPFSILTKICEFYLGRGIPFFLFAPSLTLFSGQKIFEKINHIVSNSDIVYENGARVRTGFITSYDGSEIATQTAPDLGEAVKQAQLERAAKANLPDYQYPDYVLSAAMMQKYAKYGIDYKVKQKDCVPIRSLDHQKSMKKSIYGGGLLLSERAAEEKAAAEVEAEEKAAAKKNKGKRKQQKNKGKRKQQNDLGTVRPGERDCQEDGMTFDYNSERWRRKAEAIKRRDNYQCVECLKYTGRRNCNAGGRISECSLTVKQRSAPRPRFDSGQSDCDPSSTMIPHKTDLLAGQRRRAHPSYISYQTPCRNTGSFGV